MAKLNGVQVIDMVNGEVTKIAYEEAEYAKVEGEAQVGDIALYKGTHIPHATSGAYYRVIEGTYYPKSIFTDDGGQNYSIIDHSVIFRKVSAPDLTERMDSVEQRVSALEGVAQGEGNTTESEGSSAKYVKVTDRAPKAGDFVKFDEDPADYLTEKEYYEIDRIDTFGDPQITDDDGDPHDTSGYDYEVYELAQMIEGEPKVGDKIRIVDVHHLSVGDYVKGDIFTVSRVHPKTFLHRLYVEVKETNENIFREEFEIIERPGCNPESTKRKLNSDLAPGTLVRGNVSGIVELDGRCPINDGPYGKAYNIVGKSLWIGDEQFTVLTDEEAAEYKEIARWAKIDRKPNDYKKGDIVRYKDDGEMCEVIGVKADGKARVKTVRHGICSEKDDIELITPVEHRFDKQQ